MEDESILNAFAMQSGIEKMHFEKINSGEIALNAGGVNSVRRQSQAIEHAKNLLNAEEKPVEKPAEGPKLG